MEGGRVAGAQQLLVNALRQSGQLQLANLLDDSHRITALSASGTRFFTLFCGYIGKQCGYLQRFVVMSISVVMYYCSWNFVTLEGGYVQKSVVICQTNVVFTELDNWV